MPTNVMTILGIGSPTVGLASALTVTEWSLKFASMGIGILVGVASYQNMKARRRTHDANNIRAAKIFDLQVKWLERGLSPPPVPLLDEGEAEGAD